MLRWPGDKILFILIVASTDHPMTLVSLTGLATAAVGRSHEIAVFFNSEGVRLLKASSTGSRLASLVSNGVRLLACRTSLRECGIGYEEDLVEGTEMSSPGELVELVEGCDRVVFL